MSQTKERGVLCYAYQTPPDWIAYPTNNETCPTDTLDSGPQAWECSFVQPELSCVLHLRVQAIEEQKIPDLARLLANFLTYHLRPIATDELVAEKLGAQPEQSYSWSYHEEFEDGRLHKVRVWTFLVGNGSNDDEVQGWCFANLQGPPTVVDQQRPTAERILASVKSKRQA